MNRLVYKHQTPVFERTGEKFGLTRIFHQLAEFWFRDRAFWTRVFRQAAYYFTGEPEFTYVAAVTVVKPKIRY